MNAFKLILTSGIAIALLCALVAEFQFRAETRRAIQHLQADLERQKTVPKQEQRGSYATTAPTTAPADETGPQLRELQEEVARLSAALESAQSSLLATSNSLAELKPKEIPFIYPDATKKSDYAFVGHATPEAALQSVLWSITRMDARAFRSSIAGDFANAFAADFKELPEGVMPGGFQNGDMYRATGFRVMEVSSGTADEMILKVFLEGRRQVLKPVFQRFGGEWKLVRNAPR